MKHKFKTGDLVMVKYPDSFKAIELGIILSFPETNSMWAGYARVRIVSQLGKNSDFLRGAKNGREQFSPISNLVFATTDTINRFLFIHGFK